MQFPVALPVPTFYHFQRQTSLNTLKFQKDSEDIMTTTLRMHKQFSTAVLRNASKLAALTIRSAPGLVTKYARHLATLVLLYTMYLRRKSVPGMVLYIALWSIPQRVFARLTGTCAAPKELDTFTAAIINGLSWVTEGTTIEHLFEVKRSLAFHSYLDGKKARFMGAKFSKVAKSVEWPVEGVWIAEQWNHIPWVSDTLPHDTYAGDMDDLVVFFFIHGGAYCFSTSEYASSHHFELMKSFNARESKSGRNKRLVVFSLEYPLAPEHKFPAQVHVAADAYKWLVSKVGAKNIIIGGDSAGGHCTISLMNYIAATPELNALPVQPLGNIYFSPWVHAPTSWDTNAKHDIISMLGLRFTDKLVFGHLPNKTNDILEIPAEDFNVATKGTLVIYGGSEILSDGIERFVALLKTRKMDVPGLEVCRFDGMPHCFNLVLFERVFPGAHVKGIEALNAT
ncbi:hypothetical protein HDU77_010790, partial [Chytriomyces hyalinus]